MARKKTVHQKPPTNDESRWRDYEAREAEERRRRERDHQMFNAAFKKKAEMEAPPPLPEPPKPPEPNPQWNLRAYEPKPRKDDETHVEHVEGVLITVDELRKLEEIVRTLKRRRSFIATADEIFHERPAGGAR